MLLRGLAILAVALVLHGRIGVVRARERAAGLRVAHELDGTIAAPGAERPPLRLWALGDSAMAGDGIADAELTLPRLVARMLSARTGREVQLTMTGVSGARVAGVARQLPEMDEAPADVIVVSAGVNDGLGRRQLGAIRRDHHRLVAELRAAAPGAALVLVGAPDLRHAPGLPVPLRWVVGWLTGRVGRRQASWLAGTDMTVVEMGTPRAGFGPDGFHPGPLATPVIARRVVAAVGPKVGH